MVLRFTVRQQQLLPHEHPPVVADSRGYLRVAVRFSEDWEGVEKTAVFKSAAGTVYHVLLQDGACAVPSEVIAAPYFQLSVFGGDRITTEAVTVAVLPSGCEEGVSPPDPTPDVYAQLLSQVSEQREAAESAAQQAVQAAADAQQTAQTLSAAMAVEDTVRADGENAVSGGAVARYVEQTLSAYDAELMTLLGEDAE